MFVISIPLRFINSKVFNRGDFVKGNERFFPCIMENPYDFGDPKRDEYHNYMNDVCITYGDACDILDKEGYYLHSANITDDGYLVSIYAKKRSIGHGDV